MSILSQIHACCCKCGGRHDVDVYSSIDISTDPDLKGRVLNGELFVWNCPVCGAANLARYPLLYHDPAQNLMLVLTEAMVNADGLPESYCGRIVRSPGELIEKIKIFDAGLDDVVIELCKWVTCKEIGRHVELKFFRMEGADSEMIFTYPEDGQMQMISVGSNVYEDCRAIVGRNPSLEKAASGLSVVNSEWLSQFVG